MYSVSIVSIEDSVGPSKILSPPSERTFDLAGLSGQVVEFSGWNNPAGISLASSLIRECQSGGGLCAWISLRSDEGASLFFPPDFEKGGIDCSELPILWSDSAADGFSIAEKLMSSRGFGMIVIDLTGQRRPGGRGLGRLHRAARVSGCLLLCLTRRPPGEPSLDPMVFVHAHGESVAAESGGYEVTVHIQKDKNHAPGKDMRWRYESPAGLP